VAYLSVLGKYGGQIYGDRRGDWALYMKVLKPRFLGGARQYTFIDRINFARGLIRTLDILSAPRGNIPVPCVLMDEVPKLEIPVFFVSGEQDYVVPHVLAEEYCERLRAPLKKFIRMPRTAHSPHFERPEEFRQVLIKQILPAVEAYETSGSAKEETL
jgi:pimeloyl-ACP methyl ester carboxylesterase